MVHCIMCMTTKSVDVLFHNFLCSMLHQPLASFTDPLYVLYQGSGNEIRCKMDVGMDQKQCHPFKHSTAVLDFRR